MGLLKKLLGGRAGPEVPDQHDDAEVDASHAGPVHARRRELIQIVLREAMGKHGIPSDWMACRILTVGAQQGKAGMHVQLIVRQGEERLLEFVHPFQDTFWRGLEKVDARPRDWLFSLAWQFDGDHGANGGIVVPPAGLAAEDWDDDTQPPEPDTQPPDEHADQLESDLQALYAIRDAALSAPGDPGAQAGMPPASEPDARPAPDAAR